MEVDAQTSDLVYDGRSRKRKQPPGASEFVQRLYILLFFNPDGLTVSLIHDEVRDGWLETDAYRAYDKRLVNMRQSNDHGASRSSRKVLEYGSPKFKERAQTWWIRTRLNLMVNHDTVRREGSGKDTRFFAGKETPFVMVACPVFDHHIVRMDPQKVQDDATSITTERIRREEIKATLIEALQDSRLTLKKSRSVIEAAFNHLSGR